VNNVITRIQVRGVIASPIETITDSGGGFSIASMWGIQMLINGSSLLTLPADISDYRWLTVEATVFDTAVAIWAPSSDTAAAATSAGIRLDWNGQFVCTDDMEIAFTTGQLGGGSALFSVYGSLQTFLA
jgi:hypothetical protein